MFAGIFPTDLEYADHKAILAFLKQMYDVVIRMMILEFTQRLELHFAVTVRAYAEFIMMRLYLNSLLTISAVTVYILALGVVVEDVLLRNADLKRASLEGGRFHTGLLQIFIPRIGNFPMPFFKTVSHNCLLELSDSFGNIVACI